MKRVLILSLLLVACGTAKAERTEKRQTEPQLVTRQMDPLEARPKRMGAVLGEVDESLEAAIGEMLRTEADSNEVFVTSGLTWADGTRSVIVVHVHFPPHDMTEADFRSTVDDATLQRCDTEFLDCVDGLESCEEDAYESCIRSAYRNSFVYMSSHIGIDCGVIELSSYQVEGSTPRLTDRRTLDPMACEPDFAGSAPSAQDIDGDGGPELSYTWSSTRDAGWVPQETMRETLAIIDANDLTEQFRFSRNVTINEYGDLQDVVGLTPVDDDGDGLFDLRSSVVQTKGFCVGYGWALDARFMIPAEAAVDEASCQIEIEQTLHPYDPATDTWTMTRRDSS